MRLPTVKYEEHMQRFFYRLGEQIGGRPWTFILGLLLFTAICSVGFLRFHQINNARITFTDRDSPSHVEGRVLEDFLRQNGSLHMIEVMVNARDNGSLLREEVRDQLKGLMEEIVTKVTVVDPANGRQLNFWDLCEPYCMKNEPLFALLKLYQGNETQYDLTYPNVDLIGQRIFIANNIYDMTFADGDNSTVTDFRTAMLHVFLVHRDVHVLYKWEDHLLQLLYSHKYPLLDAGAASDNIVAQEVRAMGTKTAPLLSISLGFLMVFLLISSFRHRSRESKPVESVLGGLIPILAGITTVGLVSASGLAFQSIVVSTLFLLLAIGIDDVFIMLAAWHRTDNTKEIKTRIAETVMVSGCSMTVTSITNLISFGNGVLSSTPVLQTFAIYSTVASLVCYLYQLILFPAILALTAHKEYKQAEGECRTCVPEHIESIKKMRNARQRALTWLAITTTKKWMIVPIIPCLVVFWAFSVYGILHVETDLSVQKLALPESRIVPFKNRYDEALKSMQTFAIIVNNPGDLRDSKQVERIKELVRRFEHASYSYGKESTYFWLGPYEEYLSFYSEDDDEDTTRNFTYTEIPDFLRSEMYRPYRATIRLNETACAENSPRCVQRFLLSTGFTSVVRYNEMFPIIDEWRHIAANFSDLNVTTYTERSNFADQSVSLEPVIWQTLYSEVLCMGLSFIIFIPDLISICAAMFSLLSVNLGVFGFLSLWGVGVDPFSMASLLMSIGFSVDICSHISYHYYENKAPTAKEKMVETLVEIGWPTMQGALSTLFAMSPILIKPCYLGMVFLKTVFLVNVFGLIHGLFVLPVFLAFFGTLFGRHQVHSSESSEEVHKKEIESVSPQRISSKSYASRNDDGKA